MELRLPADARVRRPRIDDAAQIHELVAACDRAVLGRVDSTLADIQDWLLEPAFDLDRDGWLVERAGQLAGFACACRKGASDNVDVDVYVRPGAGELAAPMWQRVEDRAVEIAGGLGHARAVADIGIHRQDAEKRAVAQRRGYSVATAFYRMRIDHAVPVEGFRLPPRVTLRTAGAEDQLRRAAHAVQQEAFADHFGFVPKEYDEWLADKKSQSTFDWSQLRIAMVDGEPAAMLAGTNAFVADENCGYVLTLATLPGYRGRGLASLLLRDRFARDKQLGRAGTYLHVDANNGTGALRLYESVGMRTVLAIDVWRKMIGCG